MKHLLFTLTGIIAMSLCATTIEPGKLPEGFNPEKIEQRKLVESFPRGGLPNFYAKLEAGQDVTIAYFGGSITAQNGYRVHSQKFFQEQYPNVKVNAVHAAIGGTGSNLGAYRLEHDVLKYKPDLVFVEFAVNDSGTPALGVRRSMEGIVRHIWRDLPDCDILFVYTLTASMLPHLKTGLMHNSESVMEEIADYYSIPTIHMGVEIVELERSGKLIMKASNEGMTRVSGKELNLSADNFVNADGKIPFARDGVHPYENTGHILYMEAIKRSLPAIKAAGQKGPHANLPKPMVADCWEKVVTIPFDHPAVHITGPWRKDAHDDPVTRPFLNRCDDFFSFDSGAEITFKYKGVNAAAYNIIGPQGGVVEVSIDGAKPYVSRQFDPYCTYHRLATMWLGNSTDPEKIRTITIKVTDKPIDKRAILFDHNKPDFDKNPAKYEKLRFFAGCIFIVGEIVE